MKITTKFLQILSGICILAGIIITLLARKYNTSHPDNPHKWMEWISYGIMIIGLILLMPWVKDKEKK
jgi:hypothetical protein